MKLATLECPLCGGMIQVNEGAAGERIACPLCHGTIQVPDAEAFAMAAPPFTAPIPPPPPAPPPSPVLTSPPAAGRGSWPPVPLALVPVTCPACHSTFQAPPSAAGLKLPCPQCQQLAAVPAATEPPTGDAPAPPSPLVSASHPEAAVKPVEELLPPTAGPVWSGGAQPAAAEGQVVALEERPKRLGEGAGEFEVQRLSPQEKARRRAVRSVILFLLGLAGLAAVAFALMGR